MLNLENVATIQFLPNENKIVYLLPNNFKLDGKRMVNTLISKPYNDKLKKEIMSDEYVKNNFLVVDGQNEIVNKKFISNIKREKNKVIINLNFSFETNIRKDFGNMFISKFVFYKFNSEDNAKEMFEFLKNNI